jgi:class 3 adenylate cyclase
MVAALFADITGSTELMTQLDPEEARAIVDPALKLMIAAALLPQRVFITLQRS